MPGLLKNRLRKAPSSARRRDSRSDPLCQNCPHAFVTGGRGGAAWQRSDARAHHDLVDAFCKRDMLVGKAKLTDRPQTMTKDNLASFFHVQGLLKLIQFCGPQSFQSALRRCAFESCRATLVRGNSHRGRWLTRLRRRSHSSPKAELSWNRMCG